MTTGTQITFQKTDHLITVKCSADPATISKLAHQICRLSLKADASATVTVGSSEKAAGSVAGTGSTGHPSGGGNVE